jgi:hypothetical protein
VVITVPFGSKSIVATEPGGLCDSAVQVPLKSVRVSSRSTPNCLEHFLRPAVFTAIEPSALQIQRFQEFPPPPPGQHHI